MPAEKEIIGDVALLYEQHAAGMLRYAGVLTGDRQLAEDALQEVFLRYFTVRLREGPIADPRAWLYRVLRNYLLDSLKAAARKGRPLDEPLLELPDRRPNPEAACARGELAQRLCRLLAPRELECLRLRAEGLRYEEIARILSIRSGTVGALLARCQKKIHKDLARGAGSDFAAPVPPAVTQEPYAP